jgi:hypothetical protein
MIEAIITIVLAVAVAAAIYFLLKKAMTLVINAVVGLIMLYLLNVFQVMSWFGAPDIEINLVSVLICAFGGIVGVFILVLLNLLGIPV